MAITAQPVSAYHQALYSLLPAGEYWCKQVDDELDKILYVLAEQLQAFDSQLLNTAQDNIHTIFKQYGHSNSGYTALLQDHAISVTISENRDGLPFLSGYTAGQALGKHGNRACIIITSDAPINESVKQAVEVHKQSHTFLIWRLNYGHTSADYQQLLQDLSVTASVSNEVGLPFIAGHVAGSRLGKYTNSSYFVISTDDAVAIDIQQIVENHTPHYIYIIWRITNA